MLNTQRRATLWCGNIGYLSREVQAVFMYSCLSRGRDESKLLAPHPPIGQWVMPPWSQTPTQYRRWYCVRL
jgi:hypothetical protein